MSLPPLQRLLLDGRSLSWRESGAGTPLVLMHGIGSSSQSWADQYDDFANRYRVIGWDAPGYGASTEFAQESPGTDDYANAMARLLDGLRIKTCFLLGHSLGALMAARFAAANPERVAALMLTSAAAGHARLAAEDRAKRLQDRLDDISKLGPKGMAEKSAPRVVAPGTDDATLARVRANMSLVRPRGYAQAARMLSGGDIWADLPKIACPTLVMCGSADMVTPEAINRDMASKIAGAEYVSLPGLGHLTYIESRAEFGGPILDFLARQERRAA
ncbi:MAG: alpha/beta fold hydrolase [Alphaproteobacteria bacterium]